MLHDGAAMKASKFVVLAGGILGIVAFFLPMVSVTREGQTATVSAFQVVKGLEAVSTELDKDQVAVHAASVGETASLSEAKDGIGSIKGIVMAVFAPALLLAAIGGAGLARKKFGRVAGTFSLLLGVAGLGIGVVLQGAAEGDSGIGLTMLLLTGVAGIVGGLMALVKPERAQVMTAAVHARAAA
ncbi:MAG TPA: hypothetical protein VK427_19330 [Kofleriaceae bacterium]|nr:hypothetical protein [Kofleriaceae bacterium]